MQKVLHINADKCTGCMQCEMACSFENYGTFATAKSRLNAAPRDFGARGFSSRLTARQSSSNSTTP